MIHLQKQTNNLSIIHEIEDISINMINAYFKVFEIYKLYEFGLRKKKQNPILDERKYFPGVVV